jgi:hypothetical protein
VVCCHLGTGASDTVSGSRPIQARVAIFAYVVTRAGFLVGTTSQWPVGRAPAVAQPSACTGTRGKFFNDFSRAHARAREAMAIRTLLCVEGKEATQGAVMWVGRSNHRRWALAAQTDGSDARG